jgi:hypothetical protein
LEKKKTLMGIGDAPNSIGEKMGYLKKISRKK